MGPMRRGPTLLMVTVVWAASAGAASACPSTWRAEQWAQKQPDVAFALQCGGRIRGVRTWRMSNSASTGKALLLVAWLREGRPVSPVRSQLRSMITQSDNQAASWIYNQLGDRPLARALKRMEMNHTRLCGCWASIGWSAREYSKLWASLPRALPRRNRWFAMGLFAGIVSDQRWGIPQESHRYGWRVYLKGGWRPEAGGWIVLQGALLTRGKQRMALVVFTRHQSGVESGARKIRTIARLILRPTRTAPAANFAWNGRPGLGATGSSLMRS